MKVVKILLKWLVVGVNKGEIRKKEDRVIKKAQNLKYK